MKDRYLLAPHPEKLQLDVLSDRMRDAIDSELTLVVGYNSRRRNIVDLQINAKDYGTIIDCREELWTEREIEWLTHLCGLNPGR